MTSPRRPPWERMPTRPSRSAAGGSSTSSIATAPSARAGPVSVRSFQGSLPCSSWRTARKRSACTSSTWKEPDTRSSRRRSIREAEELLVAVEPVAVVLEIFLRERRLGLSGPDQGRSAASPHPRARGYRSGRKAPGFALGADDLLREAHRTRLAPGEAAVLFGGKRRQNRAGH